MNLNSTIFFQILVFFILLFFTLKFIYPPIISVINDRKKNISNILALSENIKNDLINIQSYLKLIGLYNKKEMNKIIEETKKHSKHLLDISLKESKEEKMKIIKNTEYENIKKIRIARKILRNNITSLIFKSVEKIIIKELDFEKHNDLIKKIKSQY